MKIAVFGRTFNDDFLPYIKKFLECLQRNKVEWTCYKPFYDYLALQKVDTDLGVKCFTSQEDAPDDINFLISIGGDGTFLESLMYLKRFDIPVIGLNSGRLGFLANISREEISEALDSIISGNYQTEKRSLLMLESENNPFGRYNFALNDAAIQKNDSYLIKIDTFINGEFLNTYWTDGLILSTPTGSTAYSLSVGGPILMPGSENIIIAPIASHNLTVRPIVIPDNVEIRLEVKSRSGNFLVSVDNRTQVMDIKHNIFHIRKADDQVRMVKLPFNNYFSTLRNKLMWGVDLRN
jgi:NAD+ kinase